MGIRKDLTGQRFGTLLVLGLSHIKKEAYWNCKCDCGTERPICSGSLIAGRSRSCGCVGDKKLRDKMTTHGGYKDRLHTIRRGMKCRCNASPKHNCFKWYGIYGITYDNKREQFENFRNDMLDSYLEHVQTYGEYQTTIDRIDNSGNYCKDNCRRATKSEQNYNKRPSRTKQNNNF